MSYIALTLLATGVAFITLAGIGLLRMPTLFMRMQVTSKASTLGVILMVVGLGILLATPEAIIKGFLICLLLLITAPVAAHAIALAAQNSGDDR